MNPIKVVAFGEILFDVFDDGARLGGAPLNFAFYLSQSRVPVYMIHLREQILKL